MHGLRFSEGHKVDPRDWSEKILLEIGHADYDNGKCWLSVVVWVAVDDMWFFTCAIHCDDIAPAGWGGVHLMKDHKLISTFSNYETVLSISEGANLDVVGSTTLFREGVE